ncbi:MAG: hypothetical protein HAW59_04815, partial [Betaproteobacteria bacterium]|nr:hypothetical protein [Betaproteobacteria bacterium]
FAAPAAASGSITYGQFSQFGGNSMLPPIPAGKIQFNRDSAYIAEGAILGGLLSSQVGTFIAVGALVIGGTAVAKNVKERITEGPCVADAAAGQIRNPADNYCGLPRNTGECPAGEVFSADEADKCISPGDCATGEFLDNTGDCRAPVNGDCPAANMTPSVSGGVLTCRLLTVTDCDAGEFLDTAGDCRAPVAMDCPANLEVPMVSNGVLMCESCPGDINDNSIPADTRFRLPTNNGLACRVARSDNDCFTIHPRLVGAGIIGRCTNRDDTSCVRTPETPRVDTNTENFDCRATIIGDCATDGNVFDNTGAFPVCRASIAGDCPVDGEIPGTPAGGMATCVACTGGLAESAAGTQCIDPTRVANCPTDASLQSRVFTPLPANLMLPGDGAGGSVADTTLTDDTFIGFIQKINATAGGTGYNRIYLRNGTNWDAPGGANFGSGFPNPTYTNARRALRKGDVFLLTRSSQFQQNQPSEPTPEMNAQRIFRIYEDAGGTLRLAQGAATTTRVAGTPLTADANPQCSIPSSSNGFFLDSEWRPTDSFSQSRALTEFGSFREIVRTALGGMLNQNNAVQIKNFSFTADSSLKSMHMEYALPETKTGDISWRNYSGYRRQAGGTEIYYQRAAAEYAPAGKNWRLYALSTSGRINSEIYENTPLASFSTGFFAGKIFRHDDEYHVRLNTPFSAAEVRTWELSADMQIGAPKHHIRFGLHRNFEEKNFSSRIFYKKEF